MASHALDQWGLAAVVETTLLLVTELISNGVRHAKTMLTLVLAFDGARLYVGVSDDVRSPPVLAEGSAQSASRLGAATDQRSRLGLGNQERRRRGRPYGST